jgi:hypothetical protein
VLNRCRRRSTFKVFFATNLWGLFLCTCEIGTAQIVRVGPLGGINSGAFGWGNRYLGPPVFAVPIYGPYPYYQPPAFGRGAYLQRRYDYGDDYQYGYGYEYDYGYGANYLDDGLAYRGPGPGPGPGPGSLAVPRPTLPPRYPEVYAERPSVQLYGPAVPYQPASPYTSPYEGQSPWGPVANPVDDFQTLPDQPSTPNPLSLESGNPARFGLSLREAAIRLEQGLSKRNDAEVWLNYLKPGDIVTAMDASDSSGTVADLQALFLNYEGVAGNQELSHVWVIDGFRQTHQGLGEWLDTQTTIVGEGRSIPESAAPVATATSKPTTSGQPLVESTFEELVPPGNPEPADIEPADIEPADDSKRPPVPAGKTNENSGVQSL